MIMQVPVTHKLNHFLSFLQNQSHPQSSSVALNLCKWGALFLALLATVRTILIIKFRQNPPSISPLTVVDESDYSDDDSCSSSSSEFEQEDDEEEVEEENEKRTGDFFRIRGSGNGESGFLRSCCSITDIFSLSEIANSESVVKLRDTIGFGLGFGFDDYDSSSVGSIVSVYGANKEQRNSPAMVVSAGENASGNVALRIWDTRLRRRIPAVIAEWGTAGIGKTVGIQTAGQNVYIRDNGRYELTVGDMWNVRSPLQNVTESQLDLWLNSYTVNR